MNCQEDMNLRLLRCAASAGGRRLIRGVQEFMKSLPQNTTIETIQARKRLSAMVSHQPQEKLLVANLRGQIDWDRDDGTYWSQLHAPCILNIHCLLFSGNVPDAS